MENPNDFLEVVGYTPKMKILCFLMEGRDFDYQTSKITSAIGLTRKTVSKEINKLRSLNIIKSTRIIGKSVMYSINTDNYFAKQLMKIQDYIIKRNLEEAMKND